MGYFDPLVQILKQKLSQLGPTDALAILLQGDLGVGKTQLTKELLASFGYSSSEVQSPTFLKLIEHQVPGLGKVLHLDLYRLDELADLQKLDLESYESQKLIIVEWPDLFLELLTVSPGLKSTMGIGEIQIVSISMQDDGSRRWQLS